MFDISRYERAGVVGGQQGTRYVFECARFMHVLVTHHLHGGNEMEGRAPDAERAFRRCDDCVTTPALLSSWLISVEIETSSSDDHPSTLTIRSGRERRARFFARNCAGIVRGVRICVSECECIIPIDRSDRS